MSEHVAGRLRPTNRRQLVAASVISGSALLVIGIMMDGHPAFVAVLINIGTALLLTAVLATLERSIVQNVSDQVQETVQETVSELLQRSRPRSSEPVRWVEASPAVAGPRHMKDPIDPSPLHDLATAFNFEDATKLDDMLRTPASLAHAGQDAISAMFRELSRCIVRCQQDSNDITQQQETALRAVGNYLRGDHTIAVLGDDFISVTFDPLDIKPHDVIVVTGAAGPYIRERVVAGLALLHHSNSTQGNADARILLSGGLFGDSNGRRQTEADALSEIADTLTSAAGLDISSQLRTEDRSLSIWENVTLSLDAIQAEARRLRRPLRVAFVTAPYSGRRLNLIAHEALGRFMASGGIGAIHSIDIAHGHNNRAVDAVVDLGHGRPSDRYTDDGYTFANGVNRWLEEYFKLFGGRMVGEF